MSNDDENKRPLSVKSRTGKKSVSSSTTQYRLLTKEEYKLQLKTSEPNNNHEINGSDKTQRNRRKF